MFNNDFKFFRLYKFKKFIKRNLIIGYYISISNKIKFQNYFYYGTLISNIYLLIVGIFYTSTSSYMDVSPKNHRNYNNFSILEEYQLKNLMMNLKYGGMFLILIFVFNLIGMIVISFQKYS